jgi:L-ascorbate metabolism protein UlaG (beta-lactamase superfamily)
VWNAIRGVLDCFRGRGDRGDTAALRELERRFKAVKLAPGLTVEWLGAAGYRLRYRDETLLVDPYVSRVPLRNLLCRVPALPDAAVINPIFPAGERVVGILLGHAHFDHAVDAPALARRYRCSVLGSQSVVALMGVHGLAAQAVKAVPCHRYQLGPFAVTFVPSRHSKLVLGLKVPFDGELTCAAFDCLTPSGYKCGQVWGIHIEVGGTTFYHQGSADLVDDAIQHRGVDVFLAGVAGRSFTRDYWGRILPRLDPDVVLLNHYDDFFRPLASPMGFSPRVRLRAVPDEIAAVSREILVAAIPRIQR